MDRSQKTSVVASLHERLSGTTLVVITRQSGLTVAESSDLRRRMLKAGAGYKVTKNRLVRLALEGTKFAKLAPMFTGPTAIALSMDPVAAAKVAVEFAKTNDKIEIVGGALNEQMLDAAGIKALATLPSINELRAKFLGMLQTPATRIAGVLQAPAGQLARVLRAKADKGEAA